MAEVEYAVANGVARITMNRPEVRNAVNPAMASRLIECLRAAKKDNAVRAILITGTGRGFCAGADLTTFDQVEQPIDVRNFILDVYQPMMTLLTEIEKPVVAAVNGVAAGAGLSIALACDFRVMSPRSKLLMAFINIGLVPDAGASWLLTRAVGYSRAFELAVEGKPVAGQRCYELGLANKLVPDGELLAAATAWAEALAKRPTFAIGLTKRIMQSALLDDLQRSIELEAIHQPSAIVSADHREGMAAFMAKRDPEFQGL